MRTILKAFEKFMTWVFCKPEYRVYLVTFYCRIPEDNSLKLATVTITTDYDLMIALVRDSDAVHQHLIDAAPQYEAGSILINHICHLGTTTEV